jgi:hypothetical protein
LTAAAAAAAAAAATSSGAAAPSAITAMVCSDSFSVDLFYFLKLILIYLVVLLNFSCRMEITEAWSM